MSADSVLKFLVGSMAIYGVVAACGSSAGKFLSSDGGKGDGSPVPDAMADIDQSGTRLKAQYYSGADGSKTFAGMYDSMLSESCTFAMASDGNPHCIPSGRSTATTGYYSDEHCTTPIFGIPAACTPPPTYVTTLGTSCTGVTTVHVYPSGAATTPAATIYIGAGSGANGTCVAIPSKDVKVGSWYSTGAELSPSKFVEGTLASE